MPPAVQNYDDEEITSFLNEEIQKCPFSFDSHNGNTDFLPERLIDVGTNSLRLVEREAIISDPAERPQYCALSYCWGPGEDARSQTRTTRNNLQSHLEGLDFDALSPVLKDAVKTTRRLSIRYLWVDALCILQDDMSDWRAHCSAMNEIYGTARVTLIAASSRTCREGFLNPKRPGVQIPYQSVRRPDISGSFMLYFTHAFSEVLYFINKNLINDLHSDLNFSQWARRGWTFQEDALAGPRIVYGNAGVYFGQGNQYVCKNGPVGSANPKFVTSLESKDEFHQTWANVLRRYAAFTKSSFTNPTDVLPALSGLAKVFGNKLQTQYIAGHWVDRLHLSLLWTYTSDTARRSLDDITERHGEKPYLVPTWSCLTRGGIAARLPDESSALQSEITICGVYMPLVGTDPYGAIRDCCLTLEGFILDLDSLSWSESPKRLVGSVGSHAEAIRFTKDGSQHQPYGSFFVFDPECTPGKKRKSGGYELKLDFQVESEDDSLLGTPGESVEQLISRVTLLLVGARESSNDSVSGGYGLVLVPNKGALERSFLRIGIFYTGTAMRNEASCLKRLMKKETIKIY